MGFSARSRRFLLFDGAKVGANATLMEAAFSLPLPLMVLFALALPQFSRVQEAKNASNLRKALRKRLLRRLRKYCCFAHLQTQARR